MMIACDTSALGRMQEAHCAVAITLLKSVMIFHKLRKYSELYRGYITTIKGYHGSFIYMVCKFFDRFRKI